MIADSGGGHKNGSDESHRSASQDLRRATSLLRLLKSGEGDSLNDPELQQEFTRLHELLERIDQLAEGVEQAAGTDAHAADAAVTQSAETHASSADAGRSPATGDEHSEPGDDRPFQPVQDDDSAASPPVTEPADQPAHLPPASESGAMDDRCMRWWVHFNGDLSLERLSKLRTQLNDSPFTIDTRYDEITDGLIVMRVVTEEHISMDQLNWILGQLMDLVGLDRNSAIVSKQ